MNEIAVKILSDFVENEEIDNLSLSFKSNHF